MAHTTTHPFAFLGSAARLLDRLEEGTGIYPMTGDLCEDLGTMVAIVAPDLWSYMKDDSSLDGWLELDD